MDVSDCWRFHNVKSVTAPQSRSAGAHINLVGNACTQDKEILLQQRQYGASLYHTTDGW